MGDVTEMDEHVTENVIVESAAAPATTLASEPGPLLLQFVTVVPAALALGEENTNAATRPELATKVASPTRSRALVRNR